MEEQETLRRRLLSRAPPKEYTEEWTALVKAGKPKPPNATDRSLLIFRVQGEWLGIATEVFSQVTERKFIHTLPERSTRILLGVVNIEGQIRIALSLQALLGIPSLEKQKISVSKVYPRMVVLNSEDKVWVFPVDEVYGIIQDSLDTLENVPVTVTKSASNYLKGVLLWRDKSVGLIDHELLTYSMERHL